ncbi:MAG TPA: T9SS type A sorting domain-containing protein [Bacteroidia bacterium]|nr:T9SS type A sorting domain-containing protein [Bacteroidia bacterium]
MSKVFLTLVTVAVMSINLSSAQCPPLGAFSGMTGDFKACPGMSLTYTLTPVTNAISYTWNLPPGATISGQNPYTTSSNVVTVDYGPLFSAPGSLCVTAYNGCVNSAPYCKALTPAGAPSGASTISGSIFACPGVTETYSVTNQVNRVFDWTIPNNATLLTGQGTNSITVQYNAGFNGGNICVRVGNGCAWSGFRCMTIYAGVPGTPTAITGPTEVCTGTMTYSTGPSNGVPVTSYTWTVAPGVTLVGQGNDTVQITFPINYNYTDIYVKANNGCGSSSNRSVRVRATPETPQPIIGLASGICNGTTPYTVPSSPTAVSYNWTLTGPGTILTGQGTNNINIDYPNTFISGKICVTITNACATGSPRCLLTSKNIALSEQPQDFETCNSTQAMFSVGALGMNLQYQWRKNGAPLSNGGKISGANSDTLYITGADSTDADQYDVIVSNNCGSSITSNTATLDIKQVPAKPGAISGVQATTCPGTSGIIYSVPLQMDATSYLWTYTDGVQILNGQGTDAVTLAFDSTINSGYSVFVYAVNECGQSLDSASSWTRYKVSTPTITGPARVCENLPGVNYMAPAVAGASSYNWTIPAGATLVSGQTTNAIVVDFGPTYTGGDVTVTASNICFTTPVKKLATVIDMPSVPTSLSGQVYGTCKTQLVYTAGNSNHATSYKWTLPPNSSIILGNFTNTVTVDFQNPGSGTYSLCVAGNNACRTGTYRCIQVRAIPERPASIVANPSVFCANQTGVAFSTAGSVGADSYTWALPSTSTITSGQNTSSILADIGTNNGTITVMGVNQCGNSGTRTYAMTLNCREGFDKSELVQSVLLAPNPANDWVKLSFNSETAENYSIEVFDILGKKVLSEGGISSKGLNEHSILINKLVKGIYIVSLQSNSVSSRQKLEIR